MSSIEEVRARMQNKVSAKVGEIKAAQASANEAGVSGGPSVESLSAVSSKETETERQILVTLQEWKEKWIKRIESVTTERELSVITNEGGSNGKWTMSTGPGFVVGRCLEDLLKNYSDITNEEKADIRKKAQEMQKEIDPIYLQKREKIYQAKKAEDEAKAKAVAEEAKAIAVATTPPVVDPVVKAATDAIDSQVPKSRRGMTRGKSAGEKKVKEKESVAAPATEKSAESDGEGERLSMEYFNNFREERLNLLNSVGSIEEFQSRDHKEYRLHNFMIDHALLKKIADDHPLSLKEKRRIHDRKWEVKDEVDVARNKKENELLRKSAEAKKPVGIPVVEKAAKGIEKSVPVNNEVISVEKKNHKVVMVSGGFDPIHIGRKGNRGVASPMYSAKCPALTATLICAIPNGTR